MEKYIEQLLEDILKLSKIKKTYAQIQLKEVGSHSSNINVSLSESKDLSDLSGIDIEFLPPAERLSTDQITRLFNALVNLLAVANCQVTFPPGQPVDEKYEALRNSWTEQIVVNKDDVIEIQLCFHKKSCPSPGFCINCEGKRFQKNVSISKYDESRIVLLNIATNLVVVMKERISNEKIIPKIDFYCNRKCHSCSFTSNCMVNHFEKASDQLYEDAMLAHSKEEITDPFFMIEEGGRYAIELLKKDSIRVDSKLEEYYSIDIEEAKRSELYLFILNYIKETDRFLEVFLTKWNQNAGSDESVYKLLDNIGGLNLLITQRLPLAITLQNLKDDKINAIIDYNGLIKALLIDTEAALVAWQELLKRLEFTVDDISNNLIMLQNIKLKLKDKFPLVQNYKREHFD